MKERSRAATLHLLMTGGESEVHETQNDGVYIS